MPAYWKITDRAFDQSGIPTGNQGPLQYFVADQPPYDASRQNPLDNLKVWQSVTVDDFQQKLIAAADQFPLLTHAANEDQSHVTFLIHGYNNGWLDAANLYQKVCNSLYSGADSLGLCISFDWPSLGSVLDYLPDRAYAEACAGDLATVFSLLYDWLLQKQQSAATNPCKAKISVIAHSMGNYVTQKALATVWTRKNQPLLASLINQLVMIAADVDNDLFEPTASDGSDGNAMANLTYRITSLFSGRDAVLAASAGLKHFGARRLGRSGLAVRPPTGKDNVWDNDCSTFFPDSVGGLAIHGAYFDTPAVMTLAGDILCGIDRGVLAARGETQGNAWLPKAS
ncbi:MAG TPA: alpha/beta hydrolase [Candidatus Acidoferrum sp.]|nr:alpha/beta hydrolase [Candidatus Acidoferrum sp.]